MSVSASSSFRHAPQPSSLSRCGAYYGGHVVGMRQRGRSNKLVCHRHGQPLSTLLLDLSGSASKLVFKPLPQDDPKVRKPDITRARQLLGWQPQVNRHDGLKRTLDYFRRQVAGQGPA